MFESVPFRLLAGFAAACAVAALAIVGLDDNRALFVALNAGADRLLPDPVLTSATILGEGLCALMLLAPAVTRAPQIVAAGVLAVAPASLLSQVPKHLIAEARPAAVLDGAAIHVHGIRLAGSNSFPSGHAITAFAVVAVLLLTSRAIRARPSLALAALAGGLVVAASRIAVGAHWPSDALAGAALGSVAGVIGAWWSQRWTFWRQRGGALALAAIVAACALALIRIDTGYPSATALQYALAAVGLVSAIFGFAFHLRRPPGVRSAAATGDGPPAAGAA